MNIEEAIKYIKNDIECDKDTRDWFNDKNNTTRKQIEESIDAYETLLTAYEKEKEKNKTLEELLQGRLFELYKYYKDLASEYQGNCVSKDKIKAKIEEWQKEKEFYDKDEDREWGQYNNWDWVDTIINEMQSLLEKE